VFRLSSSGAMSVPASPKVVQVFLRLLRARSWIAGAFLIFAAAGIYGALQVPDDSAIERLIVADDPVAVATSEFDRLFPEGDQALIMLEAPDPLGLA
jgi:predicted RND superfamily exporter protein